MIEAQTDQILVQNIGQKSYKAVWDLQKEMQQQRIRGEIEDTLILVEHDPVYTLGKNALPCFNIITILVSNSRARTMVL